MKKLEIDFAGHARRSPWPGRILTVVALYYYLLVARRMYIERSPRVEPVPVPGPLAVAIFVCVVGVVGMGVYPGPWVAETARVADALFR